MALLEIAAPATSDNDPFLDLPPAFRPVAQRHGRALFTLVWHSQTAGIAIERLAAFANRHKSAHSMYAIEVLGKGFNGIASLLIVAKGWTEGQVAECDRDVILAARAQVIPPPTIAQLDS